MTQHTIKVRQRDGTYITSTVNGMRASRTTDEKNAALALAKKLFGPGTHRAKFLQKIEYGVTEWLIEKEVMPAEFSDSDMANVGRALMQAIQIYAPEDWHPMDCPSEIVGFLRTALDETIDSLENPWTPISAGKPTYEDSFLVVLREDNDIGLRADIALQAEFGLHRANPNDFTIYDACENVIVTQDVVYWMPLPDVPAKQGEQG